MRYKLLRVNNRAVGLYSFSGNDWEAKDTIFHSIKSVVDHIEENNDPRFTTVHELANEDNDEINSINISSNLTGEASTFYIVREDRPEFNIEIFADAFFSLIELNDTNKSLSIKSELDDIADGLRKKAIGR